MSTSLPVPQTLRTLIQTRQQQLAEHQQMVNREIDGASLEMLQLLGADMSLKWQLDPTQWVFTTVQDETPVE